MKTRQLLTRIHRLAGLAMTVFLVIVGLSGSLLAFYDELDGWLNPALYASLQQEQPRLDASALVAAAMRQAPEAVVEGIAWRHPQRVELRVRAAPEAVALGYDRLLLDPYTGAELGRHTWGDIAQGKVNLMPFIYRLHYELALGKVGLWTLGIVALIWTLDCFIGFYLTLPARHMLHDFFHRWRPAWQIKRHASATRINFDLHRAGGLWLWPVLLVFAWSSVYMNLWDTVYTWSTRAVLDYRPYWAELKKLPEPMKMQSMSWAQVQARAETLMQAEADKRGFEIIAPSALRFHADTGQYSYRVRSSLDIQDRRGRSAVFFDARSGELSHVEMPSGQYAGNTVTSWLSALHMANVFGLPWRIFVSLLGFLIGALCITGVLIWLRKRKGLSRAPRH